jgi:hypothetical protein
MIAERGRSGQSRSCLPHTWSGRNPGLTGDQIFVKCWKHSQATSWPAKSETSERFTAR